LFWSSTTSRGFVVGRIAERLASVTKLPILSFGPQVHHVAPVSVLRYTLTHVQAELVAAPGKLDGTVVDLPLALMRFKSAAQADHRPIP
jgi:hypothetical protein